MVKGATRTRPGTDWRSSASTSTSTRPALRGRGLPRPHSIDYSIGGSVTLEYALDDFAIAQMAGPGDVGLQDAMMQRATTGSTCSIRHRLHRAGRTTELPSGRRSRPPNSNRVASWVSRRQRHPVLLVGPQDLSALSTLMGGDTATVAKLDTFFTSLNATRNLPSTGPATSRVCGRRGVRLRRAPWRPSRWSGPSPTPSTPIRRPTNRVTTISGHLVVYVWAALGMYPVTPGPPTWPWPARSSPSGGSLPTVTASSFTRRGLGVHPYVHALT